MSKTITSVTICSGTKPYHYHDDYLEVLFVLQGNLTGVIINEEFSLQEGDICLINRSEAHSIQKTSDDLVFTEFHFDMGAVSSYIPDADITYFVYNIFQNKNTSSAFKAEIREQLCTIIGLMNDEVYLHQKEKQILNLSIDIISSLKLHANIIGQDILDPSSGGKGKSAADIPSYGQIWELIDYIYDNNNRKLSLKECADHFSLTETQLTKILREHLNLSFRDFLAYTRIECSIPYLLDSDTSITNIAYECGFSAPRYYNAVFEKYYKCTPGEFRDNNQSFFEKESTSLNEGLSFEAAIDSSALYSLLQKYKKNILTNYIDLFWDISQTNMEQTDNTFRSATIICSPSEALDYGHLPLFIQCHQELGISSYALSEVVSDDLKQTICSNLAKAGLVEMTEASGSSAISFGDLFLASGNPTVLYYRQKLLNEVIPPFAGTPHSGITYRTGNSSRMILCNDYDNRKVNYSIKITGLSFDKTYLLCSIRKSAMTDQYAETEDNTLLEMLNGPEKSLEVFSEKTSLILEEALESGDICVYTLTSM